jgi:hypothetical protein
VSNTTAKDVDGMPNFATEGLLIDGVNGMMKNKNPSPLYLQFVLGKEKQKLEVKKTSSDDHPPTNDNSSDVIDLCILLHTFS